MSPGPLSEGQTSFSRSIGLSAAPQTSRTSAHIFPPGNALPLRPPRLPRLCAFPTAASIPSPVAELKADSPSLGRSPSIPSLLALRALAAWREPYLDFSSRAKPPSRQGAVESVHVQDCRSVLPIP